MQKRLLYILGSLVIFLFVNSRIEPYYSGLGLNEKGILLAYGFTKNWILRMGRYKTNSLWNYFSFWCWFSITAAFSQTGLANEIATYLLALSSLPPILLILLVASIITFTTEVTSNTALISIALPIIYALSQKQI